MGPGAWERETDLGILGGKNIYISAFLQSSPAGNQELGCLTDLPQPPACCPCRNVRQLPPADPAGNGSYKALLLHSNGDGRRMEPQGQGHQQAFPSLAEAEAGARDCSGDRAPFSFKTSLCVLPQLTPHPTSLHCSFVHSSIYPSIHLVLLILSYWPSNGVQQ